MNRPDCVTMNQIDVTLQNISETEATLRGLKELLKELPKQMAGELSVYEERIEAASYLYWSLPEISATAIAEGLLGISVYKLKELASFTLDTVRCDRCHELIELCSRTQLQKALKDKRRKGSRYAEGYNLLCDNCRSEVFQERHEEWEQQYTRKQTRLFELKTMPYTEYLQTPEWQQRRKQHLKSIGYSCQVCNAKEVLLDVHHRTYERRGDEHFKDLIALCRECHGLFHMSGKLSSD